MLSLFSMLFLSFSTSPPLSFPLQTASEDAPPQNIDSSATTSVLAVEKGGASGAASPPSIDAEEKDPFNNDRQLELLETCENMYPRKWDEEMTTAWFTDLGVLLPDEIRRMIRGRFNGKNLIGNTLIKPLTEDDIHHKAMGVIKYWTPAEFTASLTKARIAADTIPNDFEKDIPDGETLYEQFTSVGLQSMINDYFQSDELRPLVERLWAYLTLIDDASRARDARRIFKILTPHLKDLRRRQQGFDLVDEATGRNEAVGKDKEGDENRRYGTAKVEEDTHSDSDPETVDAVDGDGEVEDDGDATATNVANAIGGDSGETKTSGANQAPLDLVTRAFAAVAAAGTDDTAADTKDASSDDMTTTRASAATASAMATSEAMKLLPRWIKAYEGKKGADGSDEGPDWKTMAVIGKLFTHISETVGQIIIEDKAAFALIRSFFPRAMGGIAGGKKFIEKNMLVKVRRHACPSRVTW